MQRGWGVQKVLECFNIRMLIIFVNRYTSPLIWHLLIMMLPFLAFICSLWNFRITSRIRKFVRVHNHMSQLQDELKRQVSFLQFTLLCRLLLRINVFWCFIFFVCLSSCIPLYSCFFHHFMHRSQVRLQRFGDQLVSDISKIGANEEDLSIDIVSNGENTGLLPIVKHNVEHNDASSHRKRLHIEREALEDLKQGSSSSYDLVLFHSSWIPEILHSLNKTLGGSK